MKTYSTNYNTRQVVPIKIKIEFQLDGKGSYPDWSKLSIINTDDDMRYHCPTKMFFDITCGYLDENKDSPRGMQWGCLLCTQEFATEAIQLYPEIIMQLTETEFEKFYNSKVTIDLPEKKYDINTLQGLQIELKLNKELKQDNTKLKSNIKKAIDPFSNDAGIKMNEIKTWKGYKKKMGFEIKKC